MSNTMRTEAVRYMREEMGQPNAKIVDTIMQDGEALVLFDNDVCLLVEQYGWFGDKWEVFDETDGDDFRRNQKPQKPAKKQTAKKKCRCREPKTHPDCMYCGSCWAGEVICGVCKENGIDGQLIRGTGRVVCAEHRRKGGAK